ncbi:hypothetical protein PPERSA_08481 [Pseudocohnilembus persalinus]|uniref:Uncharacterized protein n=1 Tax=Pseudocohnilembus persalinus TaxID=266149 RepID=A0A0V0R6H2_PSEPJ|nr:hypothetical protein PPERSA_08481 [Pseudocohnilembus persalinus]|eukprot:KRX10078.1 hypothetical protein PPERSA_08481 [Pseudocohnilembus persalinus]
MEKIQFLKGNKITNNLSDKILQIDQNQQYINDQLNPQSRQQSPNSTSFMYNNNQNDEIQILETEYDDEMEQELYMNIVLKGKSILQKFADHEGKIDFQLVDSVLTHCKFHKISLQFGILHCYNYQEIEQSLLRIIKKQEEEKKTEEQWNLLKKYGVNQK